MIQRIFSFDGYFSHHEFERLPHVDAINDTEIIVKILGEKSYWIERELSDHD